MNENKHPYSLGHRGMKGDHKDYKSCHVIQDYVEGRKLGRGGGGCGGWGRREWETRWFSRPELNLGN